MLVSPTCIRFFVVFTGSCLPLQCFDWCEIVFEVGKHYYFLVFAHCFVFRSCFPFSPCPLADSWSGWVDACCKLPNYSVTWWNGTQLPICFCFWKNLIVYWIARVYRERFLVTWVYTLFQWVAMFCKVWYMDILSGISDILLWMCKIWKFEILHLWCSLPWRSESANAALVQNNIFYFAIAIHMFECWKFASENHNVNLSSRILWTLLVFK